MKEKIEGKKKKNIEVVVLIYKDLLTLTRRIQDKYSDVQSKTRFNCLVAEQVDFVDDQSLTEWFNDSIRLGDD